MVAELVKAYALEQLCRHGDGRRGDDREGSTIQLAWESVM